MLAVHLICFSQSSAYTAEPSISDHPQCQAWLQPEFWLGGRLREVVAQGGSTVLLLTSVNKNPVFGLL